FGRSEHPKTPFTPTISVDTLRLLVSSRPPARENVGERALGAERDSLPLNSLIRNRRHHLPPLVPHPEARVTALGNVGIERQKIKDVTILFPEAPTRDRDFALFFQERSHTKKRTQQKRKNNNYITQHRTVVAIVRPCVHRATVKYRSLLSELTPIRCRSNLEQ
ncbi:hypothetical protein X777_11504, partial [Ooceraea biroi]